MAGRGDQGGGDCCRESIAREFQSFPVPGEGEGILGAAFSAGSGVDVSGSNGDGAAGSRDGKTVSRTTGPGRLVSGSAVAARLAMTIFRYTSPP